jgi:hypothetical protein
LELFALAAAIFAPEEVLEGARRELKESTGERESSVVEAFFPDPWLENDTALEKPMRASMAH